jgi:hypothetical protein
MKNLIGILALALLMVTASSCRKQRGCTQIHALNYSPMADIDDGSCYYDNGNGGNNNSQKTSITIWTNGGRQLYAWIGYIDSAAVTGNRSTAPSCQGESGCFHSEKVTEGGTYTIEAQDNDYSWKMDITIAKGCNTVLLDQSGIHKKDVDESNVIVMVQKLVPGLTR